MASNSFVVCTNSRATFERILLLRVKKEEESKADKPAETEDEELERMIREMEEEDARRVKEQDELTAKKKAAAEEDKRRADADKRKIAAENDAKLREQEREMERIDKRERKRARRHERQRERQCAEREAKAAAGNGESVSECEFMKDGNRNLIRETNEILPSTIMKAYENYKKAGVNLPAEAFETSHVWNSDCMRPTPFLNPSACPQFRRCHAEDGKVRIKVVDADVLEVATNYLSYGSGAVIYSAVPQSRPVIITLDTLSNDHNHSDRTSPDCLHAPMCEGQSLLLRTSLSASSNNRIPQHDNYTGHPATKEALYHPHVLIIRANSLSGHVLLPEDELPHIAAITMATPLPDADFEWKPYQECSEGRQSTSLPDDSYRSLIKDRMRLSLRIAAMNNHINLVLGVLSNPARPWFTPNRDMAWCWLEVLREWEFNSKANGGSWWENVVVAGYDPRLFGGFQTYASVLDGEWV